MGEASGTADDMSEQGGDDSEQRVGRSGRKARRLFREKRQKVVRVTVLHIKDFNNLRRKTYTFI